MALVVDASVALAWALPDESSAYADAVLVAVEREGLRVPDLWAREIANGLAVAYLRHRITSADEKAFLEALSNLSHFHRRRGCAGLLSGVPALRPALKLGCKFNRDGHCRALLLLH